MGSYSRACSEFQIAFRLEPRLTQCIEKIANCQQAISQSQQPFQQQLSLNPQPPDYLNEIMIGGKRQRWQRNRLPLKLFISPGCDDTGSPVPNFRPYYKSYLYQSFIEWQTASDSKLVYVMTDDPQQADIACWWTDSPDFLKEKGSRVEQGAARVKSRPLPDGSEEEIGHANVFILTINPMTKCNISDDDMKRVCLHEVGHALGFAGHSLNERDTMFFANAPTVSTTLTRRDAATMSRLYADYPTISGLPAIGQRLADLSSSGYIQGVK
jgi:hypothetical protein